MIETSSPSTSADQPAGWRRAPSAAVLLCTLALAGCGGSAVAAAGTTGSAHHGAPRTPAAHRARTATRAPRPHPPRPRHKAAGLPAAHPASTTGAAAAPPARRGPFAVGRRVITFIDASRLVRFPGRAPQQRTLVTVVYYPAVGSTSRHDVPGAPPDRAAGSFPLVVFGHGFAVTPAPYAHLLQAWARAGYVVAAPIFPLENAHAPGGPNESDLVNQPRDMRLVITRMLAAGAEPHSFLAGIIAPAEIAVSGQSDGGETALVVAYARFFVDRRVRAAMILSGAVIPGVGGFDFPAPSPPLLATQGTADTINQPHFTFDFFNRAPRPKYLLELLGAGHLPPYTEQQPQLSIIERVTIAFLDRYLKHGRRAVARMIAAGDVAGLAQLTVHR